MKTKLIISLLFLLQMVFFSSCEKDEIVITVEASDLTVNINENPTSGHVIGKVIGTTNQGSVSFSINTQTPLGAFVIDATSGELTVSDETLFDFETNPIITGAVRVANGDVHKDISIEILVFNENGVFTIDSSELLQTIDENPSNDFLIGNLYATSNEGDVTFSFIEQTPPSAFKFGTDPVVDGISIITDDETLFFFESNPILRAIIRVSNGETYQDVNVEVTLNDVTTYTELVDCDGCRALAVKGDFLYISKLDGLYKMNVNNYTGEFIEVYSGSESIGSITFIDNFLYTLWGQRIGRIDVMDVNPTWELFYQGNFVDFYDEPYGFRSLTADGTDLYFGVYCDDCDPGYVWKMNTIGTPVISSIGIIGRHNISMVFNNSFLYVSSVSVGFDILGYNRINLITFENDYILSEYDYSSSVKLASKDNYIYTTYDRDIYRFNTEGTFIQILVYDFVDSGFVGGMIFKDNELYMIRNGKIGMLNFE